MSRASTLNVAAAGDCLLTLNTDDGNVPTVDATVHSSRWFDQGSGPRGSSSR